MQLHPEVHSVYLRGVEMAEGKSFITKVPKFKVENVLEVEVGTVNPPRPQKELKDYIDDYFNMHVSEYHIVIIPIYQYKGNLG